MNSGIYIIRCNLSGKFYIGSAVNINLRWNTHRWELLRNKSHCKKLQTAWNKYGEDSFEFYVAEYVDVSKLIEIEQIWLNIYWENLLNLNKVAGSTLGYKHSEQSRLNMSRSKKGRISPMKGRRHSEETKRKMSLAHTGNTYRSGSLKVK